MNVKKFGLGEGFMADFSGLSAEILEALHTHFMYLVGDLAQNFSGEAKSEIQIILELIANYDIQYNGRHVSVALEEFLADLVCHGSVCIPSYVSLIVSINRHLADIIQANSAWFVR